MLPDHQTKPLDKNIKYWTGNWFLPEIRKRYYIPLSSANHTSRAGHAGECIDSRNNMFDMSWALIQFDRPIKGSASNPPTWIRTNFLIDEPVNE